MSISTQDKAEKFYAMHQREGCFLMPNAWDIGSAKMLAATGFDCIGTTSAGIAFSLGRPDNGFCSPEARLNREEMLAAVASISQAVDIPVNADLEAGFGSEPEDVAESITMAIAAGAVGGNIEDYAGDPACPLYSIESATQRIVAAREAIDRSGKRFVLVGRTDEMNVGDAGDISQAIERANRYREAGADCLFVPGVSDEKTLALLVHEITGPINVVMGLSGATLSLNALADLGVRRVSIGGSLARAVFFSIREAAEEMLKQGTFSYADRQIPQQELNTLFEQSLS